MDTEDRLIRDAKRGDAYAQLGLAYLYHFGKYLEYDPKAAMELYMESAENGCTRANWELYKIYFEGTIADRNNGRATKYLLDAAIGGISKAKFDLGLVYLAGDLLPKNNKEAFKWILDAANDGITMAQFLVGYMLGHGIGAELSKSEEEVWYSIVGLTGDADLFYWIGRNYEFGLTGVTVNMFEAGRWYKFGADMGHEKCILAWRSVLSALDGGRKDTLQEREQLMSMTVAERELRERDQALIQGDIYFDAGDIDAAIRSYSKAASLGCPMASYTLALLYHDGTMGKRNDRKALDMLVKASVAGSKDAQYMLGGFYEEGNGVKKNADEAMKYYAMAAANGYLTAYYRLKKYTSDPEKYIADSALRVKW